MFHTDRKCTDSGINTCVAALVISVAVAQSVNPTSPKPYSGCMGLLRMKDAACPSPPIVEMPSLGFRFKGALDQGCMSPSVIVAPAAEFSSEAAALLP